MGLRKTVGLIALVTSIRTPLRADSEKSKSLPPGVLQALTEVEKGYCDQFLEDFKKSCKQTFRANLLWQELEIAPQGRTAILVENHNMGACGSAGCSLYLFVRKADAKFVQILGTTGDVGALGRVKVLKTVSEGYYNIQKTWRDDKTQTIYRWNGQRYSTH